jgi:hypothetical protein
MFLQLPIRNTNKNNIKYKLGTRYLHNSKLIKLSDAIVCQGSSIL